ncbi:3-hydroxyisobutyrate dehydrogenase [Atopomonas sediminilitoris]|uniref:3-hydroxyisobutyrate dehydrogenase n=1 Tax=Atopomonas sediminilitoris TaxID=2919919 RepID=UPI001F4D8EED|nr:3-hydroxyisobutyrate dehydrogenase [Atopomonas sediminilitoris]MCJ8168613.1 3-hydroxyisobutyrate dehydrogenase [Atopomonas sediminilitoris]
MTSIAFIGLGNMGLPMALNLLKAGHTVRGFDLVATSLQQLSAAGGLAAGGLAANSAAEAIQGAEVVISMLPASQHVEGLYLGDGGLLSQLPANTLVLECSTIAPDSARKVHSAAHERGITMLDAPVSGGTAGAAGGTLTFMVGGSVEALKQARPILECMGKNIYHAGPDGAGQVAKVCNNQLLAVHMLGTAEALALGVANGLDAGVLSEIMRQSSGGNWSLEKYNPWPGVMDNVPASKGYSGGFMAELMSKDLGLAQQAAQSVAASTPMGSLALALYRQLLLQGKGKLDFSAVQQLFTRP